MNSHKISGGAGAQLHVVETGNGRARPILFIHGLSQCWLTWRRQMGSSLAEEFRLVALDLRGHGLSDKPRDGYSDSKLWADDVDATIRALNLDRPLLCGWSYGALLILDYLRHYGESAIGGMNFIGGATKLGSEAAMEVLAPQFVKLVPGFFATDVDASLESLRSLAQLCYPDATAEEQYLILGFNVGVAPHVRQAMLSRTVDNDDVLRRIRKPVLLTHGTRDAVVRPIAADRHKALIGHAEIHMMDTGHGCFWEDAAGFNRRLKTFAESL